MSCNVEGIILAAGLSTRMGAAKLILELDGEPVITRVVHAALQSVLARVVLVIAPDSSRLIHALGPIASNVKLHLVVNRYPERGMSTSLHAALAAVGPEATGAMVVLGDQPFLTREIIDALVGAFCTDQEKIVQPAVRGRPTTPVIFPADLFPQLLETVGDVGGREVVNRNRDRVVIQEMGLNYDDSDLDTPADVEKAAARVSARQ